MRKLVEKYNGITTYVDLKKNKLSMSDYQMLGDMLTDMINGQIVSTIYQNVALWFKRNGARVTEIPSGWKVEVK